MVTLQFYQQAGSFQNNQEAITLYDKVEQLINHLEKQAEYGVKFKFGEQPSKHAGEYNLYVNELILGDNTVLAEMDGTRITFLNYAVLHVIHTSDEGFNISMKANIDNLVKKSMLISRSGEKERARFFNRLRDRIHLYKENKNFAY